MAKRKFEMQWTDFAFIVESAGGANCHTLRDKMVDAGVLRLDGRRGGRFRFAIPKNPAKRRKLHGKLSGRNGARQ